MLLSEEAISEFKSIYAEECGELLSDDAAQAEGLALLRLFDLLCRPVAAEAGSPQDKTEPPIDTHTRYGRMGYPTKKLP